MSNCLHLGEVWISKQILYPTSKIHVPRFLKANCVPTQVPWGNQSVGETLQLNKSPLALDKVRMSKTEVQITRLGASKYDTSALYWFCVCLAYLFITFLLWFTLGQCPPKCISCALQALSIAEVCSVNTATTVLVRFLCAKMSRFQRYQIELIFK